MQVRLFTIPGSHPGAAVRQMLQRKGIAYRQTDLIPVVSKVVLKALGFPGTTVPALTIDGRKVQGTISIARELDRIAPEPPLLPADARQRVEVEQVERFADTDLQHPVRQIMWWGLRRRRAEMASYAEGARLGVPVRLAVATGGPIVKLSVHFNRADDENVRAALAGLPGSLRRIDAWIEEGVLGGEVPNAADLQVAATLRLAMTMDDLREPIAAHPAGDLALRLFPEFPGRLSPVLPEAWLEPLRHEASRGQAAAL